MSFSLNKLKQFLPTKTNYENTPQATAGHTSSNKKSSNGAQNQGKIEPEVGFKLTLDIGKARNSKEKDRPPELLVHLLTARHLPSSFGLKSVQGYMVKVKLFPGSNKFDSEIKTSSWPKFDQVFRFGLEPSHKSSFKRKKDPTAVVESPPEKFFKGNFIVFTVFALLELPQGSQSAIKETYSNFKRQGSLLLKQRPSFLKLNSAPEEKTEPKVEEKPDKDKKAPQQTLTPSETNRNIGSVTWFLDPKVFIECPKTGNYFTEEMWMPIKELAVRHAAESRVSVQSSSKGQIELTLEICECEPEIPLTPLNTPTKSTNPFEDEPPDSSSETNLSKNRISFKTVKNLLKVNKKPEVKGLCLKVTTSRMRCSIKVKEAFEKITNDMYIKTSVYQSELCLRAWKSDNFVPTLSLRWDPKESVITIPLQSEFDLEFTNVRVSVATKNKMGKKIVFGEINLGPTSHGSLLEHWGNMINSKGAPVTMWHNFE